VVFIAVTLLLFLVSDTLGWIGVLLSFWCAFFFRDPIRVTPIIPHAIISPADGIISKITLAKPPAELEMGEQEMKRISIFLNVFDVHVNRIPIDGKVTKLHYHEGKFFNASLDKASEHNERQSILLETADETQVAVVQIAGLVARRIVCDLADAQNVAAGERFGIIRFGSRVDVYLPANIEPYVFEGQRVLGGETVLANLKSKQKALESRKG
jgi:phosphatidylserine decarboxylase